jgi:hypothetical protein
MLDLMIYTSVFLLFFIGMIHLSWAFGGKKGFTNALPRKASGELLFLPRKVDCMIVSLGLIAFSFLLLAQGEMISLPVTDTVVKGGSIFCGIIFIVRAVGDFKYLGIFKSIRNNKFAKYDSILYSPLCLYIGLTFLLSLSK